MQAVTRATTCFSLQVPEVNDLESKAAAAPTSNKSRIHGGTATAPKQPQLAAPRLVPIQDTPASNTKSRPPAGREIDGRKCKTRAAPTTSSTTEATSPETKSNLLP